MQQNVLEHKHIKRKRPYEASIYILLIAAGVARHSVVTKPFQNKAVCFSIFYDNLHACNKTSRYFHKFDTIALLSLHCSSENLMIHSVLVRYKLYPHKRQRKIFIPNL